MKIPSEIVLCLKKLYLLHGSEMLPDELYELYWDMFCHVDMDTMKEIEIFLWNNRYIKLYEYVQSTNNYVEILYEYNYSLVDTVSITEKVMTL